jgi:hypothetical protein
MLRGVRVAGYIFKDEPWSNSEEVGPMGNNVIRLFEKAWNVARLLPLAMAGLLRRGSAADNPDFHALLPALTRSPAYLWC